MSLTDEAVAKIRQMIASGELGSGDRLPPEKELSEQLGLSRGSLREAVKALEMINVLSVRRGDGTYVTSLQPAMLRDAVSFMVELQRDSSILDLMAVRRVLEASAAALAAPRITEAQVAELRANVDDVDPDDVEDVVATTWRSIT